MQRRRTKHSVANRLVRFDEVVATPNLKPYFRVDVEKNRMRASIRLDNALQLVKDTDPEKFARVQSYIGKQPQGDRLCVGLNPLLWCPTKRRDTKFDTVHLELFLTLIDDLQRSTLNRDASFDAKMFLASLCSLLRQMRRAKYPNGRTRWWINQLFLNAGEGEHAGLDSAWIFDPNVARAFVAGISIGSAVSEIGHTAADQELEKLRSVFSKNGRSGRTSRATTIGKDQAIAAIAWTKAYSNHLDKKAERGAVTAADNAATRVVERTFETVVAWRKKLMWQAQVDVERLDTRLRTPA